MIIDYEKINRIKKKTIQNPNQWIFKYLSIVQFILMSNTSNCQFVAMGTTELHATCNVANFAKLHTTAIPFRDFVKVVVLLAGKGSIV